MKNPFKNLFSVNLDQEIAIMNMKNCGQVTLDGVTYKGKNIVVTQTGVFIDGENVAKKQRFHETININLVGDCENIKNVNGDVAVSGNAMDVSTVNGDVSAGTVLGNVKTVNGDINSTNKFQGEVRVG